MNSKLFGCIIAGALGATLALSPSALARGGFGGGGGHMGGGGMHAMGGGMGGGMHWGGGGGWHGGGMRFAHAGFAPRFSHAAFHSGFHHRFFHHRFHRFAFVGAPYAYASYYDSCWQRVWTRYGVQVVNVCGDYGYY